MVKMRHHPPFISSMWLLISVSLASLALFVRVHGFTTSSIPVFLPTPTHLQRIHHSSSSSSQSALSAASTGSDKEETNDFRTLYDILGASPKDSYPTLRRKYKSLARQLHPDANLHNNNNNNKQLENTTSEFSQVVAAWRVLADPKERLKYDRSLKAKQFTTSMEKFIDISLENAIPIFQKTANTTKLAVETSSKTMEQVGKRVGVAMDLLELERKSTLLEQQAAREEQQAQRYKQELATMDEKRMDKLSDANVKLSSTEARSILESFDLLEESSKRQQVQEIQSLQEMENMYQQRIQEQQEAQRQIQRANTSVENAVQREVVAQQKLAEAQRQVLEAKLNLNDSLQQQKEATTNENMAIKEMEKASLSLDTNAAKMRMSLKKREAESLQRKAVFWKEESARLEQVAEKLRRQAETIKAKANKKKQEQEQKAQARKGNVN